MVSLWDLRFGSQPLHFNLSCSGAGDLFVGAVTAVKFDPVVSSSGLNKKQGEVNALFATEGGLMGSIGKRGGAK